MKKQLLETVVRNAARRPRLWLPALVIIWCASAAAAQGDYSRVEVFLKSVLEGEDELSVEARGDLNGDGLEDWAGVIHRRRPDAQPTYQLYVLLRTRGGGFGVAEKSKEAPVAGAGCCWVEDLEIRRASIYIQNNAKTASTMEAATHQFKLYRGEWRLVGLRIYHTDTGSDAAASTETDMNLLTGAVIEKRQTGDGKPTTRRRRKRFPARLLRDFDFYNGFGAE